MGWRCSVGVGWLWACEVPPTLQGLCFGNPLSAAECGQVGPNAQGSDPHPTLNY